MPNDYLTLLEGGQNANGDDGQSKYLKILQGQEDMRAAQFRGSASLAVDSNPDEIARQKRVAEILGTPLSAVQALPQEANRAVKMRELEQNTANAPVLRQKYTDQDFAKLAHDDSANLSAIESTLNYVFSNPKAKRTLMGDLIGGLYKLNEGIAGGAQGVFELAAPLGSVLPENPIAKMAAGFGNVAEAGNRMSKQLSPPEPGILAGGVSSGVQSFAQNAAFLPLAFTPAAPVILPLMAFSAGGQAYHEAREKGVPVGTALPFAVSQGTIEFVTERAPMFHLLKDIAHNAPLRKMLLHQIASEIPGEQAATVLQDMNDWAVLHPEKSFKDYLAERPSAAAQTLIATVIGVGGNVALMKTMDNVITSSEDKTARAQQAQGMTEMLARLDTLAAASKVRERDASTFEGFVAAAAEDGPVKEVFINAQALMQSGVAEQVAAVSPAVAEQLQNAVLTGGDIAIPIDEYASRIAGTEYNQGLMEHLKTDPLGFSRFEAQEYMATQGETLKAEVERALAEQDGDQAFKDSAEVVRGEIRTALDASNRFTPDVRETYASLVSNFYAVTAAKVGMTPQELFDRYKLRVASQGVPGAQYGQEQSQKGNYDQTERVEQGGQYNQEQTPVVTLTGEEIAPLDADVQTLRAAARNWYDANLKGTTVVNVGSGKAITFDSAKKAFSTSANPDKLRLFAALTNLAQNGTLGEPQPPKDPARESNVKAYRWLEGDVTINGRVVRVGITLREDNRGRLYYNHNPVKTKASDSPDSGTPHKAGAGTDAGEAFEQSVTPNADDINLTLLNQTKDGPRGSFSPESLTITLLKNADLSTFLHESGHFFLEVQFDLASRIQGEAASFGADTLKPGEQALLADTDALIKWFGLSSLDEWFNLTFEEKRAYHERFAESFEAYLFEGKAPSIELQPLFQRFRGWLANVYRSLQQFLTGNPEAGKLNDEVRGVFDRMLATNEQIALAEQAASMMPLFLSPEQSGMDPQAFADYQALGTEATADAIQDLQARGLRDMQWINNARTRILKRLKREHAEQRREVRIDVRAEVMSEPIYQAWAFLTNKLSDNDKAALAPEEKPKSGPDLDPSIDSMFVAIAKLGGLKRADAEAYLGWDEKERSPQPLFGKHLLRREGGLSADEMASRLAEAGYLAVDENGKPDIREFEEKFANEAGGSPEYSNQVNPAVLMPAQQPGEGVNTDQLGAGRLDRTALQAMGLPAELIEHLVNLRMTARDGIHPDIVADMFGFTSGDELVRTLLAAPAPRDEIETRTDRRMFEANGELNTEAALERAADRAIHNEARARVLATELAVLEKAVGKPKTLTTAARQFAEGMIARLKIRNIRPAQYVAAEARAAKAAEAAHKKGDIAKSAAEKRNQLVQNMAAKAAHAAQDEVDSALRYLKKFSREGVRKNISNDYLEQIDNLLERFDLRARSLKAIDKAASLQAWIETQRAAGIEPDIPPALVIEAYRTPYKNLTLEEMRGLVDSVKQIEHLGRLKDRLLTAADQRAFAAVRDEMAASIADNAGDREANTRTATTWTGRKLADLKKFWAAHLKVAILARVMDGGRDGGPVWNYLIRTANERGDQEVTMRAEATRRLSEIMAPVFALGKMSGSGEFFEGVPTAQDRKQGKSGGSFNRQERIAIALNIGNAGNLQRLLGGEGWTVQQLAPVMKSLTAVEWQAVQKVWDHLESYRPLIGAKEMRVYGKEPDWVDPTPFTVISADGQTINMRGGYYPIKYDPAASQRAEEHADAEAAKRELQGAYTSATTRRSFTKARAEEVSGRPLLYSLAGLYTGVNDVIHDLAWHEWLIDVNRLLKSTKIDGAIRDAYGPEVKGQFKSWVQDIAEGERGADKGLERAIGYVRQGVSAAGLGFNVTSALMQPLGLTQSIVRVGAPWIAKGISRYIAHPIDATREANELSDFMANRQRTRFRELNELRNKVQGETTVTNAIKSNAFFLMMRMQQVVDVPTWWGAYEKAVAEGNAEDRAIALADQAVIDAQGGGQTKDQAEVERMKGFAKLFTVFYSFMNTALNLGVSKTMTANTPAKKAKLAVDYLMLYLIPAVLGFAMKEALTPGGGDDDWEKTARKLLAAQLDYLFGLMVVVREFAEVGKTISGANDHGRDYQGPAGLRLIVDGLKFVSQAKQGEFDDAFRKAAINLVGDFTGLPAAQANKTITGVKALAEGETKNPAAVVFGYQKQ